MNSWVKSRKVAPITVLLWAGLLLYLHALPGREIQLDGWWLKYHMDKVAHIIMFTVLFVLLYWYYFSRQFKEKKTIILCGLVILFYGATLEWMQGTIIDGRASDVLDLLADILGIPFGIVIIRLFCSKRLRHLRK